MSNSNYRRFSNYSIYLGIVLIVGLFAVLMFFNGSLTGQVISQNCTEVETCVNVTIENCNENCSTVCTEEVTQNCSIVESEVCEDVCVEEGNETVCTEECSPIEEEVCEDVVEEVCEEICEQIDCINEIVENCSVEEICIDIEEEAIEEENISVEESVPVEETTGEEISIENETPVEKVEEIQIETPSIKNVSLTSQELFNFKFKTGVSEAVYFDKGIINGRNVVRFVAGDYWAEKTYDNEISNLDGLIERDRLLFMKKIGGNK